MALLRTIDRVAASQIFLRDCSKEVREKPGYIGAFAGEKNHVVEHQMITANHKNQTSQVNDFLVPFYVWEDIRVWA